VTEERARELLARERARVERALAALERREDPAELADVDQHPAGVATEVFDEEVERGLAEELRERLAAIERTVEEQARYDRGVA
jgi:hypothetical protein